MNESYVDFSEVLKVAKNAVLTGGKIALEYYGLVAEQSKILTRGVTDVFTKADVESEIAMKQVIQNSFPNHYIKGEECGSNKMQSDFKWFLDPIDGTTNYLKQLDGMWGVMAGVAYKDEPIAGAIYIPNTHQLAFALKGKGANL